MVELALIVNLVKLVEKENHTEFQSQVNLTLNDEIKFVELLDNKGKERAVQWCRESGIFLLHRLFSKVSLVDSLEFIKDNLTFYKTHHLRDDKERTWLHVAVKFNRSKDILTYLINDLQIDVEKTDTNKFTVLHFACMKQEYIEGELDILIKSSNQLVARSVDDVSPLEFACGDIRKLKEIKKNKLVKINELLSQIDRIFIGLPESEDYYFNERISTEDLWTNLLQKNDKYRLINCMKKDIHFNDKYYLKSREMIEIILSCQENGQGILTYIKKRFFENDSDTPSLEDIFTHITGLRVRQKETADLTEDENDYIKSGLFLTLITGRLELIPSLLTYCQFDIILYGLLTCLVCHKLSMVKDFPEQVLENIQKIKNFSEKYSMSVLNRTVIRDLTEDKTVISRFLNKSENLGDQRIIDIAYLGKCSKFLGLPSCQEALTKLWYEKNRRCPALKFYLHSFVHCLFLSVLSYILINNFYAKISSLEIICYIYGIGYAVEEIRQMYICFKDNEFLTSYVKEAKNYLDLGAISSMLLAVLLRMALPIEKSPDLTDEGLFMESKDFNLFFIRLTLCISLILYFMRIIYFGSIFEQLGPKLKMIAEMIVKDLMPLIFIFFVFITSFGVSFQSLMFPNSFYTIKNNNTFERKPLKVVLGIIFRRSIITIFDTHYPFEELEHDEGGYIVNSDGKTAVYFLLVIYMVVVNVMLTNLLIALFSYTVTVIIQKSRESWKANRYKDIVEYYDRSLLPPPLNLVEIIIEIIYEKIQKTRHSKSEKKMINNEITMMENNTDDHKDHFISFKILQAFALKDCRYKLALNDEDKEYERKFNIKMIKKGIEKIEKSLKNQTLKQTPHN